MAPKIDIGSKIKEIRLQKGLKLRDVAKETGLSVSLISLVENNNTSPSLSTLIKLANYLGTDAGFFLENPEKKKNAAVCRKKKRKFWTSNDKKIIFELLNPTVRKNKMEIVFAKVKRFNTPPEKYTHEGEEFGLVLKGQIQVDVGDESHVLNEGDTIYFESTIPHAIYNTAQGDSEIIWVTTPPIKIL
ncbi:MAG: XRE family transcriptional regulator [Desulfobacterales bacterium]|jgi:transcriptional regulator with XRE-family HTH domain